MMHEPLFMGIDGGGSKLRIAIVDTKLEVLASLTPAALIQASSGARRRERKCGAAS